MTTTYDDLAPELLVEIDGPVRVLTMNRPDQRNSFTDELHHAMTVVWDRLGADRDARAVVLTGAGPAFSAGGDVDVFMHTYEDFEYRRENFRQAQRFTENMINFHLPVVAAVNGAAVGLGCSTAVLCDIVLMADTAWMADTHVNVGLVGGDGGPMSWPLYMSLLRAKEYIFTGDRIPAEEAVRIGLANRVVPPEALLDEARALAHRLAEQPPQALQETKRAINLHLRQAAQLVLPFAFAAEMVSFDTDATKKFAEGFRKR
jgi:enoyl-CoA hydratase/carnithine racemase